MIQTAASSPLHTKSSTANKAPDDAESRHIFVARPLVLTMTNFLGVQDTVTFDFGGLPRGSLALVVGHNGAGKSTILEAIAWCHWAVREGWARRK